MRYAILLLALTLPGLCWSQDATLFVGDAAGATGELVEVTVTVDTSEDLHGWSFGICHDVLIAEVSSTTLGADVDEDGLFFVSHGESDGGVTMFLLFEVDNESSLAADDGLEILNVEYELTGASGDSTSLDFCDTLGDPPMETILVSTWNEIEIESESGLITVQGTPFLRGDVDGNGAVMGLVDAVYLLEYGFLDGDEPPCLDAADVGDSGGVSALVDALELLEYVFANGPAPPDPGPSECGPDPTDDDGLECESADCP